MSLVLFSMWTTIHFFCSLVDHSTISMQHTQGSFTTGLTGGTVRSPLDEKRRLTKGICKVLTYYFCISS